jgi:hypothetical protein
MISEGNQTDIPSDSCSGNKMRILTKSTAVQSEEFLVLHEIHNVETILDLAGNPDEGDERNYFRLRHNQKAGSVRPKLQSR